MGDTLNNINTSVGLIQLDNPIDLRRSNGDPPHPEGGVFSPEADGETLKQMGGRVCRGDTQSLAQGVQY